jgi:hypothetical protein
MFLPPLLAASTHASHLQYNDGKPSAAAVPKNFNFIKKSSDLLKQL